MEILNQRLRFIADSLPAFVGYVDHEGRYRYVNRTYEEWFGVRREEIIGRKLQEIVGPEVYSQSEPLIRQAMSGKKSRYEVQLRRPDGKSVWLDVEYVPDLAEDGAVRGFVVMGNDISHRKASELALRASEIRFRTLFEQAPFSVQLLSPGGRTIEVNQSWKKLWGVPEETIRDLIKTRYNVLEDPQLEKKGVTPFLRRAFAGEPTDIPAIFYEPEEIGITGQGRWVEGQAYPVKGSDGKVQEVVLIHVDVTETKRATDENQRLIADLKKVQQNLEEAVRARDEFISICSHELKTPITSLRLQYQIARKKDEQGDVSIFEPETVRKRIALGLRQLDRMAKLIEEMLNVSRISRGALEISREKVDLRELLQEVVDRHSTQFTDRQLTVKMDTRKPLIAHVDPTRIEQVITNLLTNAAKYGSGRPVTVTLTSKANFAVLEVEDQGIGIAARDLERIFERYERAISASSVSGLGLGLYITRQIVTAHGGNISAESKVGEGTRFTVELPLS